MMELSNHVVMFRQVGYGFNGKDFDVQAVCSCDWESDAHAKADEFRAVLEANEHLLRYRGFPVAGPPD